MTQEEIDIMYMRRCLQIAANGLGRARPNPMVGCVVVSEAEDGKQVVVSEGFHQEYGHNHAERNALLRLPFTSHPSPLTLYVNLEPCSHYGKTPPCADLIIEKGIKRVVCCNDDPNPLVAGNGFRKLQDAGIEVTRHVLEEEGRELNRRFFTFMEKKRPYVILKWAQSEDGFMAPESQNYWLSTQPQNRLNHRWRTEEAAILVGSETWLLDKPSLTPRHFLGPQPQRIVLDRRGRISAPYPTSTQVEESCTTGGDVLILRTQTVEETLHELYERKLQSVIVEGGRKVLDSFIASSLYDEVRILRSPQHLGIGLKAPEISSVPKNRLMIINY